MLTPADQTGATTTEIRDRVLSIFEQTRQAPGTPFEPERLLAFLTSPPARKGRRVADTFGGRRRFVRFMNAIQRDIGICFTLEEWDRGYGIDDLTRLVTEKAARPDRSLRLAQQRLDQARKRRVADPVKFALLTVPLLVLAWVTDSWVARIAFSLAWAGVVGGVAAFCVADLRYSQELVRRIAARVALRPDPSS